MVCEREGERMPAGSQRADASEDARDFREPLFKRPFDFLLSAFGLLASAPLWILISVGIWLEDGRPVFFRQDRIGRYGVLFRVLKFRSMFNNPARVEVQASRNDPRITRIGRLLRRTALDELPQIWNIFVGDMSFVGPRSQPEKEIVHVAGEAKELYIRQVPGFLSRQLVRPGLTGVAQIFARREIPHRHKFRYDLIYVRKVIESRGFFGDARILVYDLSLILRSVWITVTARWEV